MSYATVSGEVAIRNHGTSVVPYVDALIAALDKYYAECDLYEILLYVQRIIENEKISIGSNGQFMKGLVQDSKLFWLEMTLENQNQSFSSTNTNQKVILCA